MNSNPIRVLALFPFLVKDSMPLFVLRQFRSSGNEVFVGYYLVQPQGLSIDEMLDFTPGQNLISLTNHQTIESSKVLLDIIRDRKIDLILQKIVFYILQVY